MPRTLVRPALLVLLALALGVGLLAVAVPPPAGAHDGHGLGCAYPADPNVCDGTDTPMPDLGPEVGHAVSHGVSVEALRASLEPAPVPTPFPAPIVTGNGVWEVPDDIAVSVATYVPPSEQDATLRTFACESGFDVFARNGSHVGLAQHSLRYLADRLARFVPGATVDQYLAGDVDVQVQVTAGLVAEQGWRPWAPSRHCTGPR